MPRVRTLRAVGSAVRRATGRAVHRIGGATRSDVHELRLELAAAAHRISELEAAGERLARGHRDIDARTAVLQGVVGIDAVSRLIRQTGPQSQPLVSVVLPTYNRAELLRRAVASVRVQSYTQWELLVVDDGGDADSERVVEAAGDERIRWMRIDHQGVCAARNAALEAAKGELIAYLDDDNVMDPDWLYAVVWAFEQYPEIDVLYGAFIVDDFLRVNRESSGHLPRTAFHPWSREALRRGNLADIGAIAHRSGLPEAYFDESLREMGDWDLLVRLTADRDPLALPAVACCYTTDAPDRLSGGPTYRADREKVRGRAQTVRR